MAGPKARGEKRQEKGEERRLRAVFGSSAAAVLAALLPRLSSPRIFPLPNVFLFLS
jgi:hypothetical protein